MCQSYFPLITIKEQLTMDILLQWTIILIFAHSTSGDISHLFIPEFNFFQPPRQQQHAPFLYVQPESPPQSSLPAVPPASATTEFFLPDIIVNRKAKEPDHGNFIPFNHYLLPPQGTKPPAVQQDSFRPPSTVYLPPEQEEQPNAIVVLDEPSQQGYEYEKPASTPRPLAEEPVPQFPPALLPPAEDAPFNDRPQSTTTEESLNGYQYHQPGLSYLPPPVLRHSDRGSTQVRLHVKEMSCLDSQGGFFRAVLKVDSFLSTLPIIENDSNDPKCDLKLNKSYLVVKIDAENFQKCGVRHCENDLCLRLRFPSIRGMRTGVDSILSLHCQTQNRVAVKTHALKMGVSNDIQARNTGAYAHGGSQNEFRTQIQLLRKSANGYTKPLEPNGVVQLGEDLLLRAHVIAGDGWNYTKLTDVSLQRVSASGHLTSSANLITSRGCVNPSMRSVCSEPPLFEPPLGHRLSFKAVMFHGMRSGEEIIMTMKITGCLEHHDCHISVQECSEGNYGRQRRDLKQNTTEFSEISKISFRVQMPSSGQESMKEASNYLDPIVHDRIGGWVISGCLSFIGVLSLLGLFVYYRLRTIL